MVMIRLIRGSVANGYRFSPLQHLKPRFVAIVGNTSLRGPQDRCGAQHWDLFSQAGEVPRVLESYRALNSEISSLGLLAAKWGMERAAAPPWASLHRG